MNKNNKNFFVWIIFAFSHMIFAMEQYTVPVDSGIVPMLHNKEIVLRLVACHYLNNHNDISSFAETNKAHYDYTMSLKDIRKKLLTKVIINGEHLGSICHKYGSAYGQAYKYKDLNELVLTDSILKDGQSSSCNQHLARFISPLPYKQAPFFTDKGELCFYGYGMKEICYKDVLAIIRYQTSTSIVSESLRSRCFMAKQGNKAGSKQIYHRFDFCMEYPFLLKAILNSSQVTHSGSSNDQELIFWLDGVTIPDNYAEKIPMDDLSANWAHHGFEHLPDIIKDFITKGRK